MKTELPHNPGLEVPLLHAGAPMETYGSDAVAQMLRSLEIPYVTLNPGASFKGLHDSLVNYTGNVLPQMLLCLHEESAVAIAHGYAKASGKMMAATVHSNVGLMHASMALFNAWCDRVPLLLLGASGPLDAAQRRPWIDWIHTCSDQGSLVRDFTKWDNQPASVPAIHEAMLRAVQIANTAPRGPVYINLDVGLQERKIGALPPLPELSRFQAPAPAAPAPELLAKAAALLSGAKNPVSLCGRGSRSMEAFSNRVALAEKLQAYALIDGRSGSSFPTDHPLHPAAPCGMVPGRAAQAMLRSADVILSLDWVDLGGLLKQVFKDAPVSAKIVNASCDVYSHRAWSMEHHVLPPVDVPLLCESDAAVSALLPVVRARAERAPAPQEEPAARPNTEELCIYDIAQAFNRATRGEAVCLTRVPIGWNNRYRQFSHPLDYMGGDGGGGLGAGPATTIGNALALRGGKRMTAAILGDGDFLMGATSVWTAVHYKIPCLMIISNNRGYYNDEVHQANVAKTRSRPLENKWIGQRLVDPALDLAMMARSQGAVGIGPVKTEKDLVEAIEKGLESVRAGNVCLVDVNVAPGYE
ncbi:MAG: thiamine pyrophosphate-binding protein [Burkholderiales bacterium]|nr:thiamine pyrophosphate-binding protein [Burkholderiales bacterium]